MVTPQSVPEGINKKQTHNNIPPIDNRTMLIEIRTTPEEYEFIKSLTTLVSKMNVQGKTAIQEDNVAEFVRFALTWVGSVYQTQILIDSRLLETLPDKDSKLEFIAFREKFMNFPKEKQLAELRTLGLVKKKAKSNTH